MAATTKAPTAPTAPAAPAASAPESGVSSEIPSEPQSLPPPKKEPSIVKPPRSTITEAIQKGKNIRVQKSSMPKKSARIPPTPVFPRGLVPTSRDVAMSRRQTRRQAKCLRTFNIVLNERMDRLSKPTRRQLIDMWRTYAYTLSAEQIHNLQNLLDAADPFKPDQAYEFFVNLRKQKKKTDKSGEGKGRKQDLKALCGDRRYAWARSATVAIARGVMRRLSRPSKFEQEGGMLRLSNIILGEICASAKIKPPPRHCTLAKSKFLIEMADKISVWVDEVISEADERMILMDYDEDDEVEREVAERFVPPSIPSQTSMKPSKPTKKQK